MKKIKNLILLSSLLIIPGFLIFGLQNVAKAVNWWEVASDYSGNCAIGLGVKTTAVPCDIKVKNEVTGHYVLTQTVTETWTRNGAFYSAKITCPGGETSGCETTTTVSGFYTYKTNTLSGIHHVTSVIPSSVWPGTTATPTPDPGGGGPGGGTTPVEDDPAGVDTGGGSSWNNDDWGDSSTTTTGSSDQIFDILKKVLTVLSGAVVLAAVIVLIIGGIQYSTAGGSPEGVTAAKKKISNVLIGLVAYVFLYAFLQWLIPGGIDVW